jgi:hypothetical protein
MGSSAIEEEDLLYRPIELTNQLTHEFPDKAIVEGRVGCNIT